MTTQDQHHGLCLVGKLHCRYCGVKTANLTALFRHVHETHRDWLHPGAAILWPAEQPDHPSAAGPQLVFRRIAKHAL